MPEDLIGDGHTELWPGMFQAEAAKGQYGKREKYEE